MDYIHAKEKLAQKGQEHLLKYYDELDEAEKRQLLDDIEGIDFSALSAGADEKNSGKIEPLEACTSDQINENKEKYGEIGLDAIRAGKVACVLLAGGQGTRLGADGPKGAYNIGITKELYIFECLMNHLKAVTKKAGCAVPFAIMTSEKNDLATRSFFEEHEYFGYDRRYIDFFVQEMVPSTDYDGKIYLESKSRISRSPNGNGGWYKSLAAAGLADKYKKSGVEWINVFAVDNVLQRMADPIFIGATISSGCEVGSKVIAKAAPDEKVGVMCLRDGRPSIVEYYELTDEMANDRDEKGQLRYNWGVILNYLLNVNALERTAGKKMPCHMVEKKIPYIDENGGYISPKTPNGYKYETLILDMISMMDGCLPFEVIREKEFAPVKNLHGVDSVDSARALLEKNNVAL